jgi:tetratricopeptide (TPR) repeat protein
MMRELEETLNLDSNHVQARLALTRFQILAGNTKDAEKNLNLMVEESGGNSEVLLLQGLYHDRLGKKDDALKVYQKLLLTSPSSESVSTLAEYLWELDQKEESIAKLEQWLAEHKEDVDVRLLLAKSYVGFGRRLDAISQYKEVLKYSENNVLALNNLAWYLKETDTQQALEYGERANSIAPESTIVLDTLASVLIKSGENERASRMIERGLARKPDSPTLLFRQVELLAAKGEREEASSQLKLLLKKHQAFPERSRAVSLLQQYEAEER